MKTLSGFLLVVFFGIAGFALWYGRRKIELIHETDGFKHYATRDFWYFFSFGRIGFPICNLNHPYFDEHPEVLEKFLLIRFVNNWLLLFWLIVFFSMVAIGKFI